MTSLDCSENTLLNTTKTNNTIRVLYVIGSLNVGGAETQLLALAEGVLLRGLDCRLFAMDGSGPLREKFEKVGVTVIDGGHRASRPMLLIRCFFRLLYAIARYKPTVVHSVLPLSNLMAVVAATFCRVNARLTSRRSLGLYQDTNRLWRYIDRISNFLSHRVVANSNAVRDDVIERDSVSPHRLVTIYNGLKFDDTDMQYISSSVLRSQSNIPKDYFLFINVANLFRYKGQDYLLKAFSQVAKSNSNCGLLFVGKDCGMGDELAKLAINLEVEDRVWFVGYQADSMSWIRAADAAVLSSLEEGFNNFLIESMFYGTPVIATRVGGNPEAIADGEYGQLVPAKDVESLSKAMSQEIDDRSTRGQRTNLARGYAQNNFDHEIMLNKYIELYDEMIR
ncbi:MAG: glycosyltransferase involved in cell wall biosynthesis [Parasphingorhabdus sp.]|jgi:glycosyltransferase involved in cell wall biosynthesis